jgi:serine/threonine protein phosphatase PrpC
MALYLRYAVRSDLGLVRSNNEDSVYAGPRLLAIADGMGGHAAGEVASKIVISTLEPLDEDRRIDDLMAALRDTVVESNHRIADAVKQRKELEGMGTTLTALRFVGSQVGLVHVGDSRAYLLRANTLSQITHDDTYVQSLVDAGRLTPEEAKDHPRRSVILRALLGTDVEPDVSIREARDGDRYLLCSDGLSDVVSAETIADTMVIEDTQECADRLVELALRGGGPDNVTVIVADVINAKVGDTIDDVPVIAGAFVDPAAADVPGADSAAERAARMSRPKPAESGPAPMAARAGHSRGDRCRPGRHLRLDADPVLRRPRRRRRSDLSRGEHRVRAAEVLQRPQGHRSGGRRPQPVDSLAGEGRHHRAQRARGGEHHPQPARKSTAAGLPTTDADPDAHAHADPDNSAPGQDQRGPHDRRPWPDDPGDALDLRDPPGDVEPERVLLARRHADADPDLPGAVMDELT